MKILFVNACPRPQSRSRKVAEHFVSLLDGEVTFLDLPSECMQTLTYDRLCTRDEALKNEDWDHPILKYSRQFADADRIVIAASYWDLSFPAILKIYVEAINCVGVSFAYNENDQAYGLCKAKDLIYITTAGGDMSKVDLGYGYIKTLCDEFYGIKETYCIKGERLDLVGEDPEKIVAKMMVEAEELAAKLK